MRVFETHKAKSFFLYESLNGEFMKKHLLSFMVCAVALPVMLVGCSAAPLANAPTQSPNNAQIGSALGYDNYLYFANAFQSSSEMEDGYDKANTGIWRIALDENKQIEKDDENSLATGQEKVIAKVAGSEYTFMYGSGNFIYFAAPSAQINPETHGEHFYTYNEYFRVNTDGTGLKKFYTSNSTITQQTVLKINGAEYLVLVDDGKLVQIKLGKTMGEKVVLAEDFTSVIFAKSYQTAGDEIAYYLKDIPEGDENLGRTGKLLYDVNIVTGECSKGEDEDENPIALNETQTKEITLEKVANGNLYFTFTDLASEKKYAQTNTNAFGYNNIIAEGISSASAFEVIAAENNQTYYVFANNTATYALPHGTVNIAGHQLVDEKVNVLFTYGDYVYFTYSSSDSAAGIHRISVQDKQVEIITDMTSIKTTNIAFDGKYIYFFALNEDNTSGTYYMHRAKVDINIANAELISVLMEEDMPTNEDEE